MSKTEGLKTKEQAVSKTEELKTEKQEVSKIKEVGTEIEVCIYNIVLNENFIFSCLSCRYCDKEQVL